MYLKSIEVQGFKSFANKILFQFQSGITGIVGPNGSGKSNVADAVRWVLGEQSAKQLRGGSMQDVIFSGTEQRKPLGFAYVAITLDNSDHRLPVEYDEVTVARRVYRSGESEYLMNGHSCRLRDVQELFLDTGIGKEGYSIIGQGQIDKILSGKPEERRELFDEAAGIVKFKKRKAAAERDLEVERLNLSRVTDILTELEKQLGPLERQSEVAKEYLKQKERLKQLEVNQFLLEQERNLKEKRQAEERLLIVNGDLSDTKRAYHATKEEYERLELVLEEQNRNLESGKQRKNELLLDSQRTQGEIQVIREQITAVERNKDHDLERLELVKQELLKRQEELDGYLKEKQSLEEQLDQLDEVQTGAIETLEELRKQITQYSTEIDFCNTEIIRLLNESSTIRTNLQRYETLGEQNQIKRAQLNQKLLRNKSEEAAVLEQIEAATAELLQVTEAISGKNKKLFGLEQELSQLKFQLDRDSAEISKKKQEYISHHTKLETLRNLTERYDGYGNSIRRVMEQKNTVPGILGVVADLIKTEKKYETAVETALGASIQNIVTQDEETAKELIGFLKRNQFGRATFLPLTSITATRFSKEEALKEPGVIGLADSLVKTEPQFQKLADFLLGRIIVVDTIQNALLIARKYHYSLRIVTLEGEQLNPGGSLSGGAYRNSGNLLGRRREIDELSARCLQLSQESEEMEKELAQLHTSCSELETKFRQEKEELQALYVDQNTAELNLKREEEKRAEMQNVFQGITAEIRELEDQTENLKDMLEKLKGTFRENEAASQKQKDQMEQYNQLLEQKREIEKEASERISNLRIEFSGFEQSSQFMLENIRRVKSETSKFTEEKTALLQAIDSSQKEREEYESKISGKELHLTENQKQLLELEMELQMQETQKEEMTSSHKSFFQKREELAARSSELDKDAYRLQSQLEKLADQIDAQISYLWEEYELSPSAAEPFRETQYANLQQTKKEIMERKNQIKALGDVNVNAIEEYKNISERFTFLKGQHEDLKASEQTLLEIITELDVEMRRQFEEKFQEIRIQFDLVFKELFGGGKGTLELTESEDILEAGIRIIAQPPGKKLQNMMQLSGGEKALTAISLLFAIQNLKPSPFCLLDEIEAALDDSNVKRYASYLHKLTKSTQFIVITHRRGTMAAADILYGITMQEKGVSTLVSVNLIEQELEK